MTDVAAGRRFRATLYVRLSNTAGDANLSLVGMLTDLRSLADRLGCEIIGEHVDDGISGSVRDRPEFLAWLDDARSGRADVMLAWSGDRLTREGINAAAMVLDVVEGKHERTGKVVRTPVRFVSFDDRLDSAEGDAFRWRFVIAAEVARGERARMVSRNTARVRRMLDQGRHVGRVPFGYSLDPERPAVLVVNAAEAEALQEAARRCLDGTPAGQVARWLNSTGQLPRSGKTWSRTTLVQALTNPANAGEPLRPGTEGRPAILSYSQVAELRRMFAPTPTGKHGGARSAVRTSQATLAGVLVCHDCGRRMRSTSGRYVCMTAADGGLCGGAVSITRAIAERDVIDAYRQTFGTLPEVRREVVSTVAAERDQVEREHAAVMRRLSTAPTADDFAELQRLTARRAELESAPEAVEARWVATGRTMGDAFDQESPEGQRDLLCRVFESVVCHPRTVRPRLVVNVRPEVADAIARTAREVHESLSAQ